MPWTTTCGGLVYKWTRWTHANKPKAWVVARYFGKFNKFRNDHWVFGDRNSGVYLLKFSWTPIARHTLVKGTSSPDDPTVASYWANRRRRVTPPLDSYTLRLLGEQPPHLPSNGNGGGYTSPGARSRATTWRTTGDTAHRAETRPA